MFCYSRFSVFLYEEISIRLVLNHEVNFSDGIIFAQWQQMMEQYHVGNKGFSTHLFSAYKSTLTISILFCFFT